MSVKVKSSAFLIYVQRNNFSWKKHELTGWGDCLKLSPILKCNDMSFLSKYKQERVLLCGCVLIMPELMWNK